MPKDATGQVKWRRGEKTEGGPIVEGWFVRVSLAAGRRPWVFLGENIGPHEEERARKLGRRVSDRLRKVGAVPEGTGETVTEFAKRWLEDRERRKLTTVTDDGARIERYVLPELGALEMAKVSKDDLKRLVRKLDERVQLAAEGKATDERGRKARFSWKTAAHVWGNVTKLFDDAVNSKDPDLCVLAADPCDGVRGPDRGHERRKQYLYPSEALALMSCEDVPLLWRRLFAVTTYLYARPEEVEALEWSDVDLAHATVRIDKAVERSRNRAVDKGEVKPPKTTNALRTVPIDPELLPLLVAMHAEAKGQGRLFPIVPSETEMSRKLRAYLEKAGVTRASLFTPTDGTQAIVWYHATRSTGITWEAIRGLDGTKLMRRAGHAAFQTTLGYIREAENMSATFGEPFPALPASLVGRGQNPPGPIGHRVGTGAAKSSKQLWAQQDLKASQPRPKRRQTRRIAGTKRPAQRRPTAIRMGRMTTQT